MTKLETEVLRDGATVMLVRDGERGHGALEVLMLRRHPDTAFGGFWAFPGGVVDDADRSAGANQGLADLDASRRLGLPSGGAAFWAAAVRETLEETGLRLGAGDLHYFSHWITPGGQPKRFDTRFFVALAPTGAHVHDEREHTDSRWVRPSEALGAHEAGTFDMILPTIRNLEAIGRFGSGHELVAAAAAATDPRAVDDGGGWRILLPGDPGHPAVAGPAGR